MTKLLTELMSATRVETRPGETPAEFAQRLARKANDLTDDKWESLHNDTQAWANSAIESLRAKKNIPLPEGIEALFPDEDDKDPLEAEPDEDGVIPDELEGEPTPKPQVKAKTKAAPKAAAKTAKVKAAPASKATGRRGKFKEGAKITIVSGKEEPFRAGTKCAEWFSYIRTGMTIAEAVAAGAPRNHVRWAHSNGFIKID